jgi:hypothetical protein
MNGLSVILLVIGTGVMVWALIQKRVTWALYAQGVTMGFLAVVVLNLLIPQINQTTQGPILSYLKQAGNHPLVTYEIFRPSLTYYARKKIMHVPQNDHGKLEALLETHNVLYVITKNTFNGQLQQMAAQKATITLLDHGPRYSLFVLKKP